MRNAGTRAGGGRGLDGEIDKDSLRKALFDGVANDKTLGIMFDKIAGGGRASRCPIEDVHAVATTARTSNGGNARRQPRATQVDDAVIALDVERANEFEFGVVFVTRRLRETRAVDDDDADAARRRWLQRNSIFTGRPSQATSYGGRALADRLAHRRGAPS